MTTTPEENTQDARRERLKNLSVEAPNTVHDFLQSQAAAVAYEAATALEALERRIRETCLRHGARYLTEQDSAALLGDSLAAARAEASVFAVSVLMGELLQVGGAAAQDMILRHALPATFDHDQE